MMIIVLLMIFFIYMLRIQIKQNTNILLKTINKWSWISEKSKGYNWIFKIQIICRMSIKNIEEYSPGRKCNLLLNFDDMITDMISNKKSNQTITELFIRRRNTNISAALNPQSYFVIEIYVRLNCTHVLF